jgi:hypothetical protein
LIGIIFWRRIPRAIAWIAYATAARESRPHYCFLSLRFDRRFPRTAKKMSCTRKPSHDSKTGSLIKNLLWQSKCSARESHYSDRHFFCNTFFGFVSGGINIEFFLRSIDLKSHFRECKQLKRERIHDRITHICAIDFVSLMSRTRRRDGENSSAIRDCFRSSKKRSPSVWRKHFVSLFDGPTISRSIHQTENTRRT